MARIDDLEKGLCDAYGVQVVAEIGDDGKEYGDPVPVAPPVGLTRSPSLAEQIRSTSFLRVVVTLYSLFSSSSFTKALASSKTSF